MAARFDYDEPAGFQRLKRRGRAYSRAGELRAEAWHLAQAKRRDAGCTKRAYASKADAETELARANANGLHLARAYRCPACKVWHVTSQKRARRG